MCPESMTVAAFWLLLQIVIMAPVEGAGPSSVTVPVDDVPPITLFGLIVTEASITTRIISVADFVPCPGMVAVMSTGTFATLLVVMVKLACVCCAGIVTETGTCAEFELLLV